MQRSFTQTYGRNLNPKPAYWMGHHHHHRIKKRPKSTMNLKSKSKCRTKKKTSKSQQQQPSSKKTTNTKVKFTIGRAQKKLSKSQQQQPSSKKTTRSSKIKSKIQRVENNKMLENDMHTLLFNQQPLKSQQCPAEHNRSRSNPQQTKNALFIQKQIKNLIKKNPQKSVERIRQSTFRITSTKNHPYTKKLSSLIADRQAEKFA